MGNLEVVSKVLEGFRLANPKDCPSEVYKLMEQSWAFKPSERPTFDQFYELFTKLYKPKPKSKSIIESSEDLYVSSNNFSSEKDHESQHFEGTYCS